MALQTVFLPELNTESRHDFATKLFTLHDGFYQTEKNTPASHLSSIPPQNDAPAQINSIPSKTDNFSGTIWKH